MKIIKLKESDLANIVKKILSEQKVQNINPKNLKFGDEGDDVKALQQLLMDKGYLKTDTMVPTGYFGKLTRAALQRAMGGGAPLQQLPYSPKTQKTNPTKTPVPNGGNKTQPTNGCQVIGPNSDIKDLAQILDLFKKSYPNVEPYGLINRMINKYATQYVAQGIPQRTACEIGLIQIRPGYKDKNAFIVDTLNKLLYLYDNQGKFIAKTEVISGKNKQSVDPKVIAQSLMTWDEQANKLGFKFVQGIGFVDQSGKNRKYDPEIIYADTDKTKSRFLPKGIYTTSVNTGSIKDYAGKSQNILSLYDGNKEISQAIHGYYLEQPRTEAIKKAQQVLSNPNDPRVGQEFMDLVSKGGVKLNQSYGCINVPENFVPYLRKYGTNSYVFNMGEDKQNYLVDNTTNYFDKMMNSQSCPSPQSLGAIPVNNDNVA